MLEFLSTPVPVQYFALMLVLTAGLTAIIGNYFADR